MLSSSNWVVTKTSCLLCGVVEGNHGIGLAANADDRLEWPFSILKILQFNFKPIFFDKSMGKTITSYREINILNRSARFIHWFQLKRLNLYANSGPFFVDLLFHCGSLLLHNSRLTAVNPPSEIHHPGLQKSNDHEQPCKPRQFPLSGAVFVGCLLIACLYDSQLLRRFFGLRSKEPA